MAKDAVPFAFASAKPARKSARDFEMEELGVANERLSEGLKELAIELSLVRGRSRSA